MTTELALRQNKMLRHGAALVIQQWIRAIQKTQREVHKQ
jgi:hypothetical protein